MDPAALSDWLHQDHRGAWQRLSPTVCALAESPCWHAAEQRLYWVDIDGCALWRSAPWPAHGLPDPAGAERWPLPSEPGCVAPAASGGVVLALRSGVWAAPQWQGELHALAPAPYDTTVARFNDGKCDPAGRLWLGTLHEPRAERLARLHRLDVHADPALPVALGNSSLANGLAFSPDGQWLYWADTGEHCVRRWPLDAQGWPQGAGELIHTWPRKPADWTAAADPHHTHYQGRPDGAAIDTAGRYWIALYEGAAVQVLSPTGLALGRLRTPALHTTMPAFCSPHGNTLVVTTAGKADRAAAAGHVWALHLPRTLQGLGAVTWRG